MGDAGNWMPLLIPAGMVFQTIVLAAVNKQQIQDLKEMIGDVRLTAKEAHGRIDMLHSSGCSRFSVGGCYERAN